MSRRIPGQDLPRAQLLTERALGTFERFTHIQAASGVVLLVVAAIALIWANSPFAPYYYALWRMPLSFSLGDWVYSQSLHFWINDALMTVFFLVVGMEVRREMHEGSLSSMRQAGLPIAAAAGGVLLPAMVYLLFNNVPLRQPGWAVPTATDIAFAVGLLALLGRAIPANVRIFLLALAIIDDIAAVLIIALFYSGGLDYSGFVVAGMGLLMVLGLQQMGIGTAYAYIAPGAVLWVGLLMTGAHPTLAGVVLGLMTPVISMRRRERPLDALTRVAEELKARVSSANSEASDLSEHRRALRVAQRELLPPVVRIQATLHPWVAFGVMPLFALANAGISLGDMDLSINGAAWITAGIMLALVVGKPLGIVGMTWLVVRLGWCTLPPGVSWAGIWLIGLFAGVGFTMSIFIATLAFNDANLLEAAKLGVLAGSMLSGGLGLLWGVFLLRRLRNKSATPTTA